MEVSGDKLVARPKQVDPQFSELVRAGRFKRVSASFYLPRSTNNPAPGSLYLRHVGFLGAAAPAVTGLKPVAFSEESEGVVSFDDADGEPSSLGAADWFRRWLSSRTPIVTIGVICPPGPTGDAAFTDYQPPPGYGVDPAGGDHLARARAYQTATGCDFKTAALATVRTARS